MSHAVKGSRRGLKVASVIALFAGPSALFLIGLASIVFPPETAEGAEAWFSISHGAAIGFIVIGVIFSVVSAGVKWWRNLLFSLTVVPFLVFMVQDLQSFFGGGYNSIGLPFMIALSVPLIAIATIPVFMSFTEHPAGGKLKATE